MYTPPDKQAWTGRFDVGEGESGNRWHQIIKMIDLSVDDLPLLQNRKKGIVIIGFMCDEGVRRNKGRPGAKEGPEALRRACCNHADHFHEKTVLFDAGNVECHNADLEGAQLILQFYLHKIISAGYFPFVFGGGHEVAFPHFMGILDADQNKDRFGIINIDAHFDLRMPDHKPSSGTPFYQISETCAERGIPFNYLCIGIQQSSNTRALFNRAHELNVSYIFADKCGIHQLDTVTEKIYEFVMKLDKIYLTICLDVFDISEAPGVSAPSAIGLRSDVALEIIKEILETGKVVSTDIAELNPTLDHDEMTAKLAAKLCFEITTRIQD